MSKKEDVQRLPAEQLFQEEIDALIKAEKNPIPTGWKMSPKSVLTYICLNTLAIVLYSLRCSTALFRRKSSLAKLIPTTATFSSLFFNSYKGSKFILPFSLKSYILD